jgi:hypothetical protein
MKERRLLYVLGVFLVVAALAQDPSLVLNDGGIQFPDGTVQVTAAVGGLAPVEDTGQTECWDEDGNSRPCAGTGEDAEFQAGVTWPTPRFTDNGDGTVTDNLTGLIWLKDANCPAEAKNWQGALDWVADLNTMSIACTDYTVMTFTDWRLPNIKELSSLADYGQAFPALPLPNPFVNVQLDFYWSSTTYDATPTSAWTVWMTFGFVGNNVKNTAVESVWPVRGGQ